MKFTREKYSDNQEAAFAMGARHWGELYGALPFDPDTDALTALEDAGGFAYFLARDDAGEPCGQAGFMVFKAPFLGRLIANDAFYYIAPEHRGDEASAGLLRFAGEALEAEGVDSVVVSHHVGQDLSGILVAAGFELSSKLYTFKGA